MWLRRDFASWSAWWPGCRAGWAGFHGPVEFLSWSVGRFGAGQGGAGRACRRVIGGGDLVAQGHRAARRRRSLRPPRTRRPATEKRRSRRRLGSQRRAGGRAGRASAVQAVSSQARATISHQIWFWAKPCSGRLRRPVSLAQRMRSSQRARRRWRSSRSASWPWRGVGDEAGEAVPVEVGERAAGRRGGGVPCGR